MLFNFFKLSNFSRWSLPSTIRFNSQLSSLEKDLATSRKLIHLQSEKIRILQKSTHQTDSHLSIFTNLASFLFIFALLEKFDVVKSVKSFFFPPSSDQK